MENNESLVIFTDDDGNEVEFEHLDTVKVGDKVYIVCVPPVQDDEEDIEEVIIFEARKDDNDEDFFAEVEDDAVLEAVYVEFKERNIDMFDFED